MRCCLMACLLKVLSDMLQNPQLLSHIHIWPKPKVKLGPTDSFYPAPPSFTCHSHCQTLSKSVLPIGISVSPRWDCNLSVYVHYQNRSNRVWAIGTTEITMQTSWLTHYQNRSHRVCVIGLTEITLCPNPNHIGPTELHFGPIENPNDH